MGVEELEGEALRAPTYGALIAIVSETCVVEVSSRCQEIGVPCTFIGSVNGVTGLTLNGEIVLEQKRTGIDEIYGSFDKKE